VQQRRAYAASCNRARTRLTAPSVTCTRLAVVPTGRGSDRLLLPSRWRAATQLLRRGSLPVPLATSLPSHKAVPGRYQEGTRKVPGSASPLIRWPPHDNNADMRAMTVPRSGRPCDPRSGTASPAGHAARSIPRIPRIGRRSGSPASCRAVAGRGRCDCGPRHTRRVGSRLVA